MRGSAALAISNAEVDRTHPQRASNRGCSYRLDDCPLLGTIDPRPPSLLDILEPRPSSLQSFSRESQHRDDNLKRIVLQDQSRNGEVIAELPELGLDMVQRHGSLLHH